MGEFRDRLRCSWSPAVMPSCSTSSSTVVVEVRHLLVSLYCGSLSSVGGAALQLQHSAAALSPLRACQTWQGARLSAAEGRAVFITLPPAEYQLVVTWYRIRRSQGAVHMHAAVALVLSSSSSSSWAELVGSSVKREPGSACSTLGSVFAWIQPPSSASAEL